jgi:hypothetical protein
VVDAQTARGTVRSIDILPADLQVWTAAAMPDEPLFALRDSAEAALARTARDAILGGGRVSNTLGWDGFANGFPVMDPRALDATEAALSGYDAEANDVPHSLPIPYLPARLGTVTGADATLYVGGWAFVGHHDNTGAKIAEGVLIAVAIVAIVVVVAVLAKGGGHGGGGGGHGGGGGGGGHISSTGGSMASSAAHSMGRAALTRSGRATALANGTGRGVRPRPPGVADDVHDLADLADDAFGHLDVQIPVRPDYSSTGPTGGRSAMYLEMTLVDNHTGLALWHAHQTFPASADHPGDVARAARTMLASLPR